MLSKKMAFSLMSLITLLAFAFITVPVMAADDFDATFSVDSVSTSSDHNAEYAQPIVVTLTFGAKVDGTSIVHATDVTMSTLQVLVEDKFGAQTSVPVSGDTGATNGVAEVTAKDIDRFTADDQSNSQAFTFTIPSDVTNGEDVKVHLYVAKGVKELTPGSEKSSKAGALTINLVGPEPTVSSIPTVMSIVTSPPLLAPADGYTGGAFDVVITLSEKPKEFKAANVGVDKGTPGEPVYLGGVVLTDSDNDDRDDNSTGTDGMLHRYNVTITPKAEDGDLIVKVNEFEDQVKGERLTDAVTTSPTYDIGEVRAATANKYIPVANLTEGMTKLTVKIKLASAAALAAGLEVKIANETRIPANGYLVLAEDIGGSGVKDNPENDKDEPTAAGRTPAQLLYNVVAKADLPNLETFLANGGTIDLVSPTAGLIISEVMWGTDASLDPNSNSQWIEIKNSGASFLTGDGDHKLVFYGANETASLPDMTDAANNIKDRIGTVGASGFWGDSLPGQGGRSGVEEKAADIVAVVPTQALVSMQRVIDAAGVAADGTMASSWAASTAPALNFDTAKVGVRIGSPGAAPVAYPVAPTPDPVVTPDPVAMPADIMISEIMVDTGGNRLPQWIELSNVSGKAVSLAGWSLMISNADADADVVGSSVSINLSGSLGVSAHEGNTGKGQSLLLVAWGARSSSSINADLVMNVSSQVGETGRYTLISEMGFMIGLVPPQTSGILTYGDAAGNLDEGWELPVSDGGRSSLIRREADALGAATMGTAANGWVLASDTALVSGPATWYGSDEDAGTPGYDAGGPLPVSLSHFRPARDEAGAVVITWSTQSELNNAGFFIKRSQQRNGQFKVINAAMVQGAGTTSEKQFYTYTDTTAQPNVVYYYQIEDVSLDGNRQTLTNGIRLKGHIGAAGKLTTTWGDLKTLQ